ncbi:hypothetical protein ACLQ29_19595 [Micromonospora sp. DT228]|uniref:hypothetical protein n=1 Tax=Micromonospora sp. DT228 TaxID=3393443 RepID=UPI003CEBAF52
MPAVVYWVALAYVQKPPVNATFQIKAILTTSAVRATPGADDLIVWSDDMAKAVGLVAETPTVTVKVADIVQATGSATAHSEGYVLDRSC